MAFLILGVLSVALAATDVDGDGFTAVEGDCDDADALVSPAGLEACDAVDNDCDGEVDEGACDCREASYGDHAYLLCDDGLSWEDARDDCLDHGYDLITVNDAREDLALIVASVGLLSGSTWIGLNDQAREGTFVWESGSDATFRDWGLLQPDDGLIFGSEDCVAISVPLVGVVAQWYDEDCDMRADYVCEASCEDASAWLDADGDGYGDSDAVYTGCTVPDGYV